MIITAAAQALILGVVAGVIANTITAYVLPRVGVPTPSKGIWSLWTVCITLYVAAVFYLAMFRWCAETGLRFGLLLSLVGSAEIGAAAAAYWTRQGREGAHRTVGVSLLVALIAADTAMAHYICFACPETVGDQAILDGHVVGDLQPCVAVHPLKSPFWVFCRGPTPGGDAAWRTLCQFSGLPGDAFEVLALASGTECQFRERQTIEPRALPADAKRSRICHTVKTSGSGISRRGWDGQWMHFFNSTVGAQRGLMTLKTAADGVLVTGRYRNNLQDPDDDGKLEGQLKRNGVRLEGTWERGDLAGRFYFTLSEDEASFDGRYSVTEALPDHSSANTWSGTRIGGGN